MMKGREILYIIYKHFKVSETEGHILDFQDLLAVKMHSDDLKGFFRRMGAYIDRNAEATGRGVS